MNNTLRMQARQKPHALGLCMLLVILYGVIMVQGCSSNESSSSSAPPAVDASYIKENEGSFTLVDVRSPEEYAAGHIPGAINLEYAAMPRSTPTVSEDQKQLYEGAGIEKDTPLVLYCRTGVRAQAASEALIDGGFKNIRIYAGSWADWAADPSNPIEK